MHYYAQVDGNDIVYSVSCLSGEVDQADMIPIDSYDQSLLGKIYNRDTGEFETPEE